MSSKRHLRRKGCEGKQRHASEYAALAAIKRAPRYRFNATHLAAYACRFCGGWHTGHAAKLRGVPGMNARHGT